MLMVGLEIHIVKQWIGKNKKREGKMLMSISEQKFSPFIIHKTAIIVNIETRK